jgi:hypothetical protein
MSRTLHFAGGAAVPPLNRLAAARSIAPCPNTGQDNDSKTKISSDALFMRVPPLYIRYPDAIVIVLRDDPDLCQVVKTADMTARGQRDAVFRL